MTSLLLAAGAAERMGISAWFLAVAVGCFLLLLASMVFGHDHDHDADHDHDVDHDHGGGHASPMSPFSVKVILTFGVGFGAGGYIGARNDLLWLGSLLSGLLGGLVIGGIGYAFLNALYTRQGSSTVQPKLLVGATGIVDTTIDPGSVGRVVVSLPSGRETFLAKSATGERLALNTSVKIVRVEGAIVSVEPNA
jgi:membrane protein implicated in regulation of membrane protease activity